MQTLNYLSISVAVTLHLITDVACFLQVRNTFRICVPPHKNNFISLLYIDIFFSNVLSQFKNRNIYDFQRSLAFS